MPADAFPELTVEELDHVLTAQLAVAWAGEGHVGEVPRLGWWRSDLISEFGAELRAQASDPDGVLSLFRVIHWVDEQVPRRWTTSTRIQLASKLLPAARDAELAVATR